MENQLSTILFDEECRFCRSAVAFVRRRDRAGRFRYVPLGSAPAGELLAGDDCGCDTLHLFDAAGHHDRSTAVLRIAADLGRPWSVLRHLLLIPRGMRDAVYDFVARHRRRFGRAA